jgi:hypothetical protein
MEGLERLRLTPLLFRALRDRGDPRAAELAAGHDRVAAANLVLFSRVADARDVLGQRGLAGVLFKGGAFLVRYSRRDIGMRALGDLDLLVPRERFAEAVAALREAGWRTALEGYHRSGEVAPAHTLCIGEDGDPGGAVQLDVHRQLAQWPLLRTLPARVLSRCEAVGGWRVPSPVDTLLIAALHRARHGFLLDARDLVDLQRTADDLDEAGWRLLADEAGRARLTGAVYAALRQAHWWFGADDEVQRRGRALLRLGLGGLRASLLERMAPGSGPYVPSPVWQRPLARNLLVFPVAFRAPLASLAAAGTFLPRRAWEEWERAGVGGANGLRRVRRVARALVYGTAGKAG